MDSTFISLNGIRLHVVQDGPEDGHLVILLHGFPEFWYCWKEQIKPLTAAGFRVLAPDQRGYNLSSKPLDVASYRLEATSRDVLRLMDSLGRKRAAIAGHDWGGGVGWWLAAHYPERVDRLVILNMPHPLVIQRTLLRSPGQVLKSLYAAFFQFPWLPEAILRNNDWDLLAKNMQATSRPGTFSEADFDQYRRAWWQKGAITGMLNWYRANLRYRPDFPDGGIISVPTLIIWGAKDTILGREMAQESFRLCKQGRIVMFEEATHWVQHEEAPQVSSLLLDFLGE